MLPLPRERLNLQREMRTVAKSLDLIAMGEAQRAAGALAQRLKALELMVDNQSWGRAAHIELLPAEGTTLVEPDESWVAMREHVLENKLRLQRDRQGSRQQGESSRREGQRQEGPKVEQQVDLGGSTRRGGARDEVKSKDSLDEFSDME
jgi:hypothetical protein